MSICVARALSIRDRDFCCRVQNLKRFIFHFHRFLYLCFFLPISVTQWPAFERRVTQRWSFLRQLPAHASPDNAYNRLFEKKVPARNVFNIKLFTFFPSNNFVFIHFLCVKVGHASVMKQCWKHLPLAAIDWFCRLKWQIADFEIKTENKRKVFQQTSIRTKTGKQMSRRVYKGSLPHAWRLHIYCRVTSLYLRCRVITSRRVCVPRNGSSF